MVRGETLDSTKCARRLPALNGEGLLRDAPRMCVPQRFRSLANWPSFSSEVRREHLPSCLEASEGDTPTAALSTAGQVYAGVRTRSQQVDRALSFVLALVAK
jgi:hypothetical protein